MIRSASASLITTVMPGCSARICATAIGSSVAASEGSAAMVTRPVFRRATSRARATTEPRSPSTLSTTGSRSSPACVNVTERVLRSNSFTPSASSSSRICAESAGCVACSASAALVKLPSRPMETKARNCRRLIFIIFDDNCDLNYSFEL